MNLSFEYPDSQSIIAECKKVNLLPPLDLTRYYPEMENQLLVCVTEANTKGQIDKLLEIVKSAAEAVNGGN